MSLGSRRGTVESFDPEVGVGQIVDERGDRWFFHCTAIIDGSRSIDPETAVGFNVGAGGPGRWEAFGVAPIG